MSDRFITTTFRAGLIEGVRTPAPTNITPEPGEVGNPDPGGDGGGSQNPGDGGGGQGTGGDIGNPTGSGEITLGEAPVITANTDDDYFVPKGSLMSITFTASSACTLLPKRVNADMTKTYSTDGTQLTISWFVPASMPGDSIYIGCEAHIYGSESTEAISDKYVRVHIGKVAADIHRFGKGTSIEIIQDAIESSAIKSGDTVIIADDVYTNIRDQIGIGYFGNQFAGSNLVTPNGVDDGVETVPLLDYDGNNIGNQTFQKTSKYTTIMAETPYGVIIDRESLSGQGNTIVLTGRARQASTDGFRFTYGIAIRGFAFRHVTQSITLTRTDTCKVEDISFVGDVSNEDYAQASGREPFYGDVGIVAKTSTANCVVQYINAIANTRAGVLYGAGNPSQNAASRYSNVKNSMLTLACVRPYAQTISQHFLNYGGRKVDFTNCWAIDGGLFRAGFENNYVNNLPINTTDHFSFQITNGAGDDMVVDGCLALKDSRSGWNNSSNTQLQSSTVRNCVFFDKFNGYSQDPMLRGGNYTIEKCTLGKNSNFNFQPGSIYLDNSTVSHDFNLAIYPSWNYIRSASDTYANGGPTAGQDDNFAFAPRAAADSYMSGLTNFLVISDSEINASGIKYLGRIEPNTPAGIFGAGCNNIFAEVGDNQIDFINPDYTNYTRHDGYEGRAYLNWMSNAPWRYWLRERREYSHVANGQTFVGGVGVAAPGINPTDYVNRQGTNPNASVNAPYIDDIYGYMDGSTAVLRWRPVCPAYRSTITGYDILVDGINVAANQDKGLTSFSLSGINSGTRLFNVRVKDSTYGDSYLSRTVTLVVP